MKTKSKPAFASMPGDYPALCQVFPPRPIRDDVGYRNTVEIADAFAGFENRMTADQNDYFDLLCQLIEEYEAASSEPPRANGLALLAHLVTEHGLSGADVSRILGRSGSLGPMILRGERKITADHAVSLGRHFGLRPDAFLG
jgi:antitoxin component HigA of HigAB toxin-antitoxin module